MLQNACTVCRARRTSAIHHSPRPPRRVRGCRSSVLDFISFLQVSRSASADRQETRERACSNRCAGPIAHSDRPRAS
eukprot:5178840-Prymnesium_polylepis.1